jgi:hypothetical protein
MLKVLVVIPHYYRLKNKNQLSHSSHSGSNLQARKNIVTECINSYNSIFEELEIDGQIILVGDGKNSLLPLDVDFSESLQNCLHLPWKAIDYAALLGSSFDYIIISEDDISPRKQTIKELIEIESLVDNSILVIPNRIEIFLNTPFCVDLLGSYRWKSKSKKILGGNYRKSLNTHSGFILLSFEKFEVAYRKRKYNLPTKIGELGYLESALANLINSFEIYRKIPINSSLEVIHLDGWLSKQIDDGNLSYDKACILVTESNEEGKSFIIFILKKFIERIYYKMTNRKS